MGFGQTKGRIENMRRLSIAVAVLFLTGAAGSALAASKCDGGVTKAIGKKVACKCGVIAKGFSKGLPPDPAKLAKCEAKFTKACTKAGGAGDCSVQSANCSGFEMTVDDFVAMHCSQSPSGAFLE